MQHGHTVLTSGALIACVSFALATPSTGLRSRPFAQATMQEGLRVAVQEPLDAFVQRVTIAPGQEDIRVPLEGAYDTFVQRVTIAPGSETGWHGYHGPHVILVVEGVLTVYAAREASCLPHLYRAGSGLYSPGVDEVRNERNEGSVPLIFYAGYFLPVGSVAWTDRTRPANCGR